MTGKGKIMSISNIRKVITSNAGNAIKYVKKNPLAFGVVGEGLLGGLIIGKAMTKTRKEATEDLNRMILTNPALNPLGCFYHMLNPKDTEANALDGPILKFFVDKNNKRYQEYYDNLSPAEKVQEFYKNGGKGVNFGSKSHLGNVVNADDGGKIYVYTNDKGKVIGSINTDKHGRVRNVARNNSETQKTDLSVNINPDTNKINSVYIG